MCVEFSLILDTIPIIWNRAPHESIEEADTTSKRQPRRTPKSAGRATGVCDSFDPAPDPSNGRHGGLSVLELSASVGNSDDVENAQFPDNADLQIRRESGQKCDTEATERRGDGCIGAASVLPRSRGGEFFAPDDEGEYSACKSISGIPDAERSTGPVLIWS